MTGFVGTLLPHQESGVQFLLSHPRAVLSDDVGLGWFYAGAANLIGAFDPGAYTAQRAERISPATHKTFRSSRDPLDAVAKMDSDIGWSTYHKGMDVLRLKLEERGLHSFSQRGAEDLNEMRKGFIADLRTEHRSWGEDYDKRDGRQVARFLEMSVVSWERHPSLAKRSDMDTLAQYLEGRRVIREVLAQRKYKSLERNPDIAAVWEQFTAELVASDVGFNQMWTRQLESDDLAFDVPVSVK